jgi:glutamyl-tRNA synthetase
VTQYRDDGFLPDAMVNYLARLGWSHGDDEIFSREQFLEWFNLDHLGRSAAQFDETKLRWVNAQHMKTMPDEKLAQFVAQQLQKRYPSIRTEAASGHLAKICALFKDRCDTTVALADWAAKFYAQVQPNPEEVAKHVVEGVRPAIGMLAKMLETSPWDKATISEAIKEVLRATGMKMPQLAMPVRVLVMGTAQTPSLDAVLELCGRETVLERLKAA